MSKEIITSRGGEKIEVDVTQSACAKFGFSPRQRFDTMCHGPGAIVGVGKGEGEDSNDDVLWVVLDEDSGKASYVTKDCVDILAPM